MNIDAWLWWLIGAAGLGIGLVITAMPELGMLAVGAVDATYRVDYLNYKEAAVTYKIK